MVTMPRFPARPTVASVLASSTLLNTLSAEDRDYLAGNCHLAFAERGQVIWLDGRSVDFFGVVGVGFVKMVKSTEMGQEVTQEIMGPGQIFGMLGIIDGGGCPLSARTVMHTWYLKVPRGHFMPIYERSVALHKTVVVRTTLRLRQAHDMLARLSTATVETRLAAVLIMLAESYGRSTSDGIVIDVPLTRQDLAEMAGTTVESTIRVMSKWQKQSLVQTLAKVVTLKEPDRLVETMRY